MDPLSEKGSGLELRPGGALLERALEALAAAGQVESVGRGRARRWTAPAVPGFTTPLLLPAPLPAE